MPNIYNSTLDDIEKFLEDNNDTRGYSIEELDESLDIAIEIFTDILYDTNRK